MKTYFHAFAMCQSMFCAIPSPWKIWDQEARDKMLLSLPLVGLEMGLIWAAVAWLSQRLGFPHAAEALILAVYPFFVTGYIHLDGFMDVTDAVRSYRDLERRREILKDSHVGSFAVISLCLLAISQFAFFYAGEGDCKILVFLPAVSRCCSALAVTVLPAMSTSQYAEQKKPKSHVAAIALMMVLLTLAGFVTCGKYGFALLGGLAGYGLALRRAYGSLEGMNGDIAGYSLTISELCGVIVWALI